MTILIIVAHPDDEVLGCGGSIAKWSMQNNVHVLIVSEGATSREDVRDVCNKQRELSLLSQSAANAAKILGATSVKLLGFPDNRMDSLDLLDVVKPIEKIINSLQPITVVTHHSGDLNIDHRIVHKAVITACRPQFGCSVKRILTFETPSSTEWQPSGSGAQFHPNWFEDISATMDKKISALKEYKSEMRDWPHSRSLKAVECLAKWRGASVGCKMAESFLLIRELRVDYD